MLCHIVSSGDPCFDPALQRAHARVTFVHQHAGDTRRARFVGSTTVNDHVAIGRDCAHDLLDRLEFDFDRPRDAPRLGFPRQR